ncbi:hypothetical protein L226DRAFT_610774 [Lentinus tigrinus ALCF2SS1-7]|uniref:Uncharacterized protein n=1 Tax=Lentinus tigrinus ALCF2SS1-6 TaxID=1328759 RepID=A0A5C2SG44_9APHY|nr:hypothetical protein L227DRAFT_435854 [Lentinus tigrinus ALCF2SS1-6]RPD77474.1 hypothetical protein L226DRAFT_610774 [Lentinus tigrinus ALCF2SS1-7]
MVRALWPCSVAHWPQLRYNFSTAETWATPTSFQRTSLLLVRTAALRILSMITAGMRAVATYHVFIFWATVAHALPASSASNDVCGNIHLTCTLLDLEHPDLDNSSTLVAYPRRRVLVADQPDSLHSAWEPTPQDVFDPCDLASSTSAMTQSRHSHPPSLSTLPNHSSSLWPSYADGHVHELERPDVCPSAAPATRVPPRHCSTSTSSGSSRDRARLRRSTSASAAEYVVSAGRLQPPHDKPGHASEPLDFGAFVQLDASSSRTPLGVLYHSCSLWELASLVSAVAWLLVCLAA